MTLSEEAMRFLEEQIPELAAGAFKTAYLKVLSSGNSVLISEDGNLVEVFPDGRKKIIKSLPPSIPVVQGRRIII